MNQVNFGVDHWVEMFREIGLDDKRMSQWHHVFENRYPEAHDSFLRWLALPPGRVEEIRSAARRG